MLSLRILHIFACEMLPFMDTTKWHLTLGERGPFIKKSASCLSVQTINGVVGTEYAVGAPVGECVRKQLLFSYSLVPTIFDWCSLTLFNTSMAQKGERLFFWRTKELISVWKFWHGWISKQQEIQLDWSSCSQFLWFHQLPLHVSAYRAESEQRQGAGEGGWYEQVREK